MTKCKRRLPVTEKVLQQRLSVIGDPVGGRTSGGGGVVKNIYKRENPNSLRQTQQLISTFHTLNKKLELAKTLPNNDDQLSSIHAELEELGGLHAYQRASLRGGDMSKGWGATGKWILPYLKTEHSRISLCSEHANLETGSPPIKLRLLDVGAITGETYIRHSNILDIVSIDLNSQSPKVTQQDFFKRPLPANDGERFHAVCLSLVINFVGDPASRGLMISLTRSFLLPGGLLYIVLPLPCITNSRYMTHPYFLTLLASLSFELVDHHHARKLAYYIFRKSDTEATPMQFPKKIQRDGGGHNNFAVVLL